MNRQLFVLGILIASVGDAHCQETLYWEASQLRHCKHQMASPSEALDTALKQLRINADSALTEGPFSVTHKEMPPPSGDKHDYVSYARYWWPDPDKPDGLPYIRRDGESNYDLLENGDRRRFGRFVDTVRALSLASYFFEDPRYADRAKQLIRVWFLEPETRMNPHLNYAQGIPGKTDGRSLGVIDTRDFITILDAVALLDYQAAISLNDQQQLKDWFSEFFVWIQSSELGRGEAAAKNNHGTWYDAQTARIALFIGDEDAARRIVTYAASRRIAEQFAADGSQPDELSRSQTLHYTYFNLEGFSVIARLGERLGVDLWNKSSLGVGLETGIRYVVPYTHSERPWPHPQTHSFALSLGPRDCCGWRRLATETRVSWRRSLVPSTGTLKTSMRSSSSPQLNDRRCQGVTVPLSHIPATRTRDPQPMPCSFIYFDMGKVLLEFDHDQMCRQMAAAAGCAEEAVRRAVFDGGHNSLHRRIERGEWSPDKAYRHFCESTGTRADQAALEHAASDMFAPMPDSIRLVESLHEAGRRLGVLSNTNLYDWRFVSGERYPFLTRCFETHVLSFEVGAMKPDPAIYAEAVGRAGVPAGEVFFTDDRPENIDGARQAGVDAVLFESAQQIERELAQRGVVAGG